MPTYVAFLRAVNVGKRMFAKADIVAACETAGCSDVVTYLNTGNVRVTTPLRSRAKVEAALEKAFAAAAGFEVSTIVFTPKQLSALIDDADRLAGSHPGSKAQYVSLLKEDPTAAYAKKVEAAADGVAGERLFIVDRGAHLLRDDLEGYHSSRLGNAWVEKRLGVATNRNLKVLRTLAEKWGTA